MPVQVKGTFQNREQEKYHPTLRKKVLATADVSLQQVQVVDSKGQVRSVVVWKCGTDVLYATTMDGLLDEDRRRPAPKWMIEQLSTVEETYDSNGNRKNSVEDSKFHIPESGNTEEGQENTPEFVQR